MDMVVMLLTGNLTPNWTASRKLLGDQKFLHNLRYLDKENIPHQVIVNCRDIIRSNNLSEQKIQKASGTATVIFKWVYALVCIYHMPKVQNIIRVKVDIKQALDALR